MTHLAWVDVFSTGPMTGNPLAVVLDAGDWPASRMQALAAELGISETAFTQPAESGGDGRVRIFTPQRELPIAGHPLVGAAWVLHAAGRTGEVARLETAAGTREARVRGGVATVDLGAPVMGPEVDAAEVAVALGLATTGTGGARIWSVGVRQLMVAASDAAAVRSCQPDLDALCRLGARDDWIGVSVYAADGGDEGRLAADVRHFAPLIGVPEDPVTGSAAGALAAHLVAGGAAGPSSDLRLVVRQSTAAGRGGEVAVRVAVEAGSPGRVQVGGRVDPLFEGRLVAS